MTARPINLPQTIDPRGADMSEAGKLGAGAVRSQPETMAGAERPHGALPLSPHIHPSGGVGGTIKGAGNPPVAQRGMGTAGNGQEWYPDHPSQLTPGMPHASEPERNAVGTMGVERAHQDTASTLPDERRDQGTAAASPPPAPEGAAGAPTKFMPGGALDGGEFPQFPPGGEKGFGAISPEGTAGDLPAPYGSEWSERHHGGMQATDLPVHDALAGLPQSISPEEFANAALNGTYGTAWPPGLNGDKR